MQHIVIYGPRGSGGEALADRIRRENAGILVTTINHLTMEQARAACTELGPDLLFIPAPLNSIVQFRDGWPPLRAYAPLDSSAPS